MNRYSAAPVVTSFVSLVSFVSFVSLISFTFFVELFFYFSGRDFTIGFGNIVDLDRTGCFAFCLWHIGLFA